MKRKTQPIVRTRVYCINMFLLRMSVAPEYNGFSVEVKREGYCPNTVRKYHRISMASVMRVARLGRSIGEKAAMR